MDALTLLEKEHTTVKGLLRDLEGAEKPTEREKLFKQVYEDLKAHEIIEEEIFYPALREHPKAKDIVLESLVEHDVVDRLMGELKKMKGSDEMFPAKAKVMKENVEHHIEEEEGEMWRKARQVFDKQELEELGARMTRRRIELDRDGVDGASKR
jgi:hemerythrin-like domain-containing protein